MVSVLVRSVCKVLFGMPAARLVLARRERKEKLRSDETEKYIAIRIQFAEKEGGFEAKVRFFEEREEVGKEG